MRLQYTRGGNNSLFLLTLFCKDDVSEWFEVDPSEWFDVTVGAGEEGSESSSDCPSDALP